VKEGIAAEEFGLNVSGKFSKFRIDTKNDRMRKSIIKAGINKREKNIGFRRKIKIKRKEGRNESEIRFKRRKFIRKLDIRSTE